MRGLTELDLHERRVLGCLLEKEQTTPEYYPLTLNALIAACNQSTNRFPVLSMKRHEVLGALHRLERENMVQRVTGPRVDRWSHLLIQQPFGRPPGKSLLTVLLLRGAQTAGELRSRTDRMHEFGSPAEVEEILQLLASMDPPLARQLARQPGQKESRWMLATIGEDVVPEVVPPEESPEGNGALVERVARLEVQVAEILEILRRALPPEEPSEE